MVTSKHRISERQTLEFRKFKDFLDKNWRRKKFLETRAEEFLQSDRSSLRVFSENLLKKFSKLIHQRAREGKEKEKKTGISHHRADPKEKERITR